MYYNYSETTTSNNAHTSTWHCTRIDPHTSVHSMLGVSLCSIEMIVQKRKQISCTSWQPDAHDWPDCTVYVYKEGVVHCNNDTKGHERSPYTWAIGCSKQSHVVYNNVSLLQIALMNVQFHIPKPHSLFDLIKQLLHDILIFLQPNTISISLA